MNWTFEIEVAMNSIDFDILVSSQDIDFDIELNTVIAAAPPIDLAYGGSSFVP